jgi:hypothetical protein
VEFWRTHDYRRLGGGIRVQIGPRRICRGRKPLRPLWPTDKKLESGETLSGAEGRSIPLMDMPLPCWVVNEFAPIQRVLSNVPFSK